MALLRLVLIIIVIVWAMNWLSPPSSGGHKDYTNPDYNWSHTAPREHQL